MRISHLAYSAAIICIGTLALFATPCAGSPILLDAPASFVGVASPSSNETTAIPWAEILFDEILFDEVADREKSMISWLPATIFVTQQSAIEFPTAAPREDVAERPAALELDGGAVGIGVPWTASVHGLPPPLDLSSPVITLLGDDKDADVTHSVDGSSAVSLLSEGETDARSLSKQRNVQLRSAAISNEAASQKNHEADEIDDGVVDEIDEEFEDEEPNATPTLERDAPPRPGATVAKSHLTHHRPLILSNHPSISPGSPFVAGENQTRVLPAAIQSNDGLIVSGIGVRLTRTPEDVALTRNGVEIANLDWLLDTAMRLGGRRPRIVYEGESFTIAVTVEARNVSITEDDLACIVLVPPPAETGVYEIVRIERPGNLCDGERSVWEFSVLTRAGRLTLDDLTLHEERHITNLTSTPDIFSFRAYAFTDDQDNPSVGLSDPVISLRPIGEEAGTMNDSPLPNIYTLAGIQDSTLLPSETIIEAWGRGIGHDTIASEAAGHLSTLGSLDQGVIADIYVEEGGSRIDVDIAVAKRSFLDMVSGLFGSMFGWLSG